MRSNGAWIFMPVATGIPVFRTDAGEELPAMTIGFCCDCRFWNQTDEYGIFTGTCLHRKVRPAGGDLRMREDELFCFDAETGGHNASLATGGNFGCVHWHAKLSEHSNK